MVKDEALHAEREKAMLQACDESESGVSREEACAVMRCSPKQAGYHIQLMTHKGMIVRVRGGVMARYCRPVVAEATRIHLEEMQYGRIVAVRQIRVSAKDTRVEVPKRPISSVFALAEAMA